MCVIWTRSSAVDPSADGLLSSYINMAFYVYVLRSTTTGKIYIGQTDNLTKRVYQHNDPNCYLGLYTKYNNGPWFLVYSEVYQSRTEALKREKQLKTSRGRAFIKQQIY